LKHTKLEDIIDLKQWHKIQELFADVIGVSIYTVDPEGKLIIKPSKVSRLCHVLRTSTLYGSNPCFECIPCIPENVKSFLETQRVDISCPCGLHNFVVPITVKEKEIIGFLIAGPFILGGRKRAEDYKKITDSLGVDIEIYMDLIREVKVFSYTGVRSVETLLYESINYLVKLGFQKNKLENWLPGFLRLSDNNTNAYAHLYLNKLLNSLLDIAISIVNGESGSVMIYDKNAEGLYIKSTRGLNFDFNNQNRFIKGDNIASYVAKEKKGYLFNGGLKNQAVKTMLKRNEIKSSMVVPIKIGEIVYGVFSVNSYKENKYFSKRNLGLLNKLGELTAAAISTFNIKDLASNNKESMLFT